MQQGITGRISLRLRKADGEMMKLAYKLMGEAKDSGSDAEEQGIVSHGFCSMIPSRGASVFTELSFDLHDSRNLVSLCRRGQPAETPGGYRLHLEENYSLSQLRSG